MEYGEPEDSLGQAETKPSAVAEDPSAKRLAKLQAKLRAELRKTKAPRVTGKGPDFDTFRYFGGAPKYPGFKRERKK